MLDTVKKFEESKKIINLIEGVKNSKGEKLVDSYKIAGISFWELAKPILNIHILPGIDSRNFKYSLFGIFYKYFRSKRKQRKLNISSYVNVEHTELVFLGFTDYMVDDIFTPLYNSFENVSYSLYSDSPRTDTANILDYWDIDSSKYSKILLKQYFSDNNVLNIFNWQRELTQNGLSLSTIYKLHFWLTGYFLNEYIKYIILAEKLVSQNSKIKNIVELDIADPRSRAFVLIGKKYNVKITTIQFAFYFRDSFEWFYNKADSVIIWGKWFEDLFTNYFEIAPKKLSILGSPRFDKFLNLSNYEITEDNKSALIISSYEISNYKKITKTISFKKYLETIIELLIEEGYQVFIKIHPLETDLGYLNKYFSQGLVVISLEELNKTICKVKYVISHGSSLTFNALALNKTIIYPIDKKIVWWDDIFASCNLGIGFNNYNELRMILNSSKQISLNPIKSFSDFVSIDTNQSSSRKILNKLHND